MLKKQRSKTDTGDHFGICIRKRGVNFNDFIRQYIRHLIFVIKINISSAKKIECSITEDIFVENI